MRIFFLIVLIFSPSLTYSTTGFETAGAEGRADAMGQAFIGLADDATAVWWNPAGLAQLKKREIYLSGAFSFNRRHASQSLGNSFFPSKDSDFFKVYPTEPSELGSNSSETMPIGPSAGIYLGKFKGFASALSFFASAGAGIDWRDKIGAINGDVIGSRFRQTFFNLNSTLSIAREVLPNLYLGVNLNRVTGSMEFLKSKGYVPLPFSSFPGYASKMEWKGKGATFSFDGGVLFRPHERIRMGFIIRGGYGIPFKGTAKSLDTVLQGIEAVRFEQKLHFPIRYGFGFFLRPLERLNILFDISRSEWDDFRIDMKFRGIPSFFKDRRIDLHLRDVLEYRLGIEYLLNDTIVLRGGFYTALSFQDKIPNLSVASVRVNSHRGGLSFGLGYRWAAWEIEAHYSMPLLTERKLFGIDHHEEFLHISFGFSYKF